MFYACKTNIDMYIPNFLQCYFKNLMQKNVFYSKI